MRLFFFYNRYKCWHEKFPHLSWLRIITCHMQRFVLQHSQIHKQTCKQTRSSQKSISCKDKHLIIVKPCFHPLQVSFQIFQFSGRNEQERRLFSFTSEETSCLHKLISFSDTLRHLILSQRLHPFVGFLGLHLQKWSLLFLRGINRFLETRIEYAQQRMFRFSESCEN